MGVREARSDLFHKTMGALESTLTAQLVGSNLDLDSGVFPQDTTDGELVAWADGPERHFSRIPLSESGFAPVTHVAEIDLPEQCVTLRRAIALDDLLAAGTPIRQLIPLLARRRFYFLLNGPDVGQIVTVSDLNRLPVRVYLFAILSHLEGLMADFIVDEFPDDCWLETLSDKQRTDVGELYAQKKYVDVDTRMIDCTTLTHKFTVIARTSRLRERFGAFTKASFVHHVKPVRELRDRMAHGLDPIEEAGADRPELNLGEPEVLTEALGSFGTARAQQLEDARDDLMHAAAISRRHDPAWLAGVCATIDEMIRTLAEGGSEGDSPARLGQRNQGGGVDSERQPVGRSRDADG